jgi:hypothetical protein
MQHLDYSRWLRRVRGGRWSVYKRYGICVEWICWTRRGGMVVGVDGDGRLSRAWRERQRRELELGRGEFVLPSLKRI